MIITDHSNQTTFFFLNFSVFLGPEPIILFDEIFFFGFKILFQRKRIKKNVCTCEKKIFLRAKIGLINGVRNKNKRKMKITLP